VRTLLALLFTSALLAGCAATGPTFSALRPETSPPEPSPPGVTEPAASREEAAPEEDLFVDPFAEAEPAPSVADPIEPVNRAVFWVNDRLYYFFLRPVKIGYRTVLPETARSGIGHFFTNITMPVRAINDLLQLKGERFLNEFFGFIINTTAGFGGFMDLRGPLGLATPPEDFGQTLGTYGVGHGFYLVLPILGPSSLRDATGTGADFFAAPLRYPHLTPWELTAAGGVNYVNTMSLDKDTYEAIVEEQVDPYLFIRNAYFQLRQARTAE
jgi:phospholipid-binding lipoprotein MlaA